MEIEWGKVEKILIIRLRSIGDTVLTTPTLTALRQNLPNAKIDVLLEDWVAPVLDGFDACDKVVKIGESFSNRSLVAQKLRSEKYDAVVNLHGGSTSGFLTRATGAPVRIGYKNYRNGFLYTHRYPPASDFWGREETHSAEQQIALLGFAGLDIKECPDTNLVATNQAKLTIKSKLKALFVKRGEIPKFALLHASAAYETKQWPPGRFAAIISHLRTHSIEPVFVTTFAEQKTILAIERSTGESVLSLSDLSLPEVTALASFAKLFIGNDSGIAHIAAAVKTPPVVIFGSSNRTHWRPWTKGPNRIVFHPMPCQPCPGDYCREYDKPECIRSVKETEVILAIDEILETIEKGRE